MAKKKEEVKKYREKLLRDLEEDEITLVNTVKNLDMQHAQNVGALVYVREFLKKVRGETK